MLEKPFRNRTEAGRALARELATYADRTDVQILALPRGGVPVAFELANALHAPLDVFLVRKLGVPWQRELAMGAIATGGVRVMNHDVLAMLDIPPETIDRVAAEEQHELDRRERIYRGDRPAPPVRGRIVILVDDGLATGSTMRAAIAAVRQMDPARVVVAVPVAAPDTCRALQPEVNEMICLLTPAFFSAVGQWYEEFTETSDGEVRELLARAAAGAGTSSRLQKQ